MEFLPSIGPEVLWGLAFIMWAWDAKLSVVPGSRVFQTALWVKKFINVDNPLGAFRRWVYFPHPLQPFLVSFVVPIDLKQPNQKIASSERWLFERNLKDIDVLGFVSGVAYLVIFVVAPLLTLQLSLLLVYLTTVLIVYMILIYQFFWLWRRRHLYRLSGWKVIAMTCHCLFFPPYAANFARAVVAKTSLSKSASRVSILYKIERSLWMGG